MAWVMKGWSWRNHGLVCGALLVLAVVLGLLDGGLGLLGLVSVPAALLLGTAATLSTVMVAARRPAAAGIGRLYGAAVLVALVLLVGVLGVARLVTALSQQGQQEQQAALAAEVVLAAFSVEDMTARATFSPPRTSQLKATANSVTFSERTSELLSVPITHRPCAVAPKPTP